MRHTIKGRVESDEQGRYISSGEMPDTGTEVEVSWDEPKEPHNYKYEPSGSKIQPICYAGGRSYPVVLCPWCGERLS